MEEHKIRELAIKHVNWYLSALEPQLIDHFMHGFKHGQENNKK